MTTMLNIACALTDTARHLPAHEALVGTGPRMTYAELDEASDRAAGLLLSANLNPGDRVALASHAQRATCRGGAVRRAQGGMYRGTAESAAHFWRDNTRARPQSGSRRGRPRGLRGNRAAGDRSVRRRVPLGLWRFRSPRSLPFRVRDRRGWQSRDRPDRGERPSGPAIHVRDHRQPESRNHHARESPRRVDRLAARVRLLSGRQGARGRARRLPCLRLYTWRRQP